MAAPAVAPVGIGWRAPHHAALLAERPRLGFVEVHAENHFADGGPALAALLAVRAQYPVSLHGVGLALGSAAGLDEAHLARLARLVERCEPMLVSEHAAFARAPLRPGGPVRHAADLLPMGRSPAALALLASQVGQVQDRLKRPILVEPLATCLAWADEAEGPAEPEFFATLCRRTGCGLLLDLNNLVVNALNRWTGPGTPPGSAVLDAVAAWVDALDPASVGQIHLAGHHPAHAGSGGWVIDDHGRPVPPPVWRAHAHALARLGPRPTLIEWDSQLPPLAELVAEARRAEAVEPALWQPLRSAGSGPAGALSAASAAGSAAPASAGPGTDAAAIAREAERQQRLLAALGAPVGSPAAARAEAALAPWLAPAMPGRAPVLAVLRANARAVAARTLAAAFPTVAALLGDDAFAPLSRRHWLDHPPEGGDLGDWGAALPEAIAADERLAGWPWLADVARVDWAMHAAGRAADAPAGPPDLSALAEADPATLRLVLAPGTALVCSPWPVVQLVELHRQMAPGSEVVVSGDGHQPPCDPSCDPPTGDGPAWAALRAAIAVPVAEAALVWRPAGTLGIRLRALAVGDAAFVAAVCAGRPLGDALDAALRAVPGWSFSDWLVAACRDGLLVAAVADASAGARAGAQVGG